MQPVLDLQMSVLIAEILWMANNVKKKKDKRLMTEKPTGVVQKPIIFYCCGSLFGLEWNKWLIFPPYSAYFNVLIILH